jgi:hypothetical protein
MLYIRTRRHHPPRCTPRSTEAGRAGAGRAARTSRGAARAARARPRRHVLCFGGDLTGEWPGHGGRVPELAVADPDAQGLLRGGWPSPRRGRGASPRPSSPPAATRGCIPPGRLARRDPQQRGARCGRLPSGATGSTSWPPRSSATRRAARERRADHPPYGMRSSTCWTRMGT